MRPRGTGSLYLRVTYFVVEGKWGDKKGYTKEREKHSELLHFPCFRAGKHCCIVAPRLSPVSPRIEAAEKFATSQSTVRENSTPLPPVSPSPCPVYAGRGEEKGERDEGVKRGKSLSISLAPTLFGIPDKK